jgi:hypothetical protein
MGATPFICALCLGHSQFHNDRHIRLLLVLTVFGSIGRSGAKEAQADGLPSGIG